MGRVQPSRVGSSYNGRQENPNEFSDADGNELFFRTSLGVAVAPVDANGDSFRAKRPDVLFEGNFVNLFPSYDYDVYPDGQRFVMFQGQESTNKVDHVVMITNWFAELEETFASNSE